MTDETNADTVEMSAEEIAEERRHCALGLAIQQASQLVAKTDEPGTAFAEGVVAMAKAFEAYLKGE